MSEKLTEATVLQVAKLARLKMTEAEVQEYATQLGQVLEYIAILDEIEIDDVEPMAHAVEFTNVLRVDEVTESLPREEALANAPKTDGRYFLVPQILDDQS